MAPLHVVYTYVYTPDSDKSVFGDQTTPPHHGEMQPLTQSITVRKAIEEYQPKLEDHI